MNYLGYDKDNLTLTQLEEIFREYNSQDVNPETKTAVIVYSSTNWDKPFSKKSRSYRVYSNSKAFKPYMLGNGMPGDCLDGTDDGVRLDWYDWDVDYCYIEDGIESLSVGGQKVEKMVYKSYEIEYNPENNRFCVFIHGDDVIFTDVDEARRYIDEFEAVEDAMDDLYRNLVEGEMDE